MEILYKTGDLFESGEPVIAHSCNCAGGFGTGVAGAIAAKYPEVKKAYLHMYNYGGAVLGRVQGVQTEIQGGPMILNMFCQKAYGYDGAKYISYDALDTAIRFMDAKALAMHWSAIAFPLIGTKRGGGRWPIIARILETHSINFQPIVYTEDGKIPE